jgi:filamentous hemagglutinin
MIAAAPEAVAFRGARVSPAALRSEEAAIAAARASEQSKPVVVVESVPMVDVPYSPRGVRAELESRYGADNLLSTTVPPTSGKNVRLAGQAHPDTGIVFDSRGFPIFDDVAAFDTRLPNEPFREATYTGQMRLATQDLRQAIERGEIPTSRFTSEQLRQINSGAERIDEYTWHHHQETGRMQLVPRDIHGGTGHVGGEAMGRGR